MDFITVAGFVAGLALVIAAVLHGSDNPAIFLDVPGLLIVMGGLITGSLVSFPGRELYRMGRVIMLVMRRERLDLQATIAQIQHYSAVVSREGLEALEPLVERAGPPFLRDGLEMVLDQVHPDEILSVYDRRIELTYEREMNESKILRTLAKMAPSLGMLGTTVGLVTMMTQMDASQGFGKLGTAMATALTTTFYGLTLAHLVFSPLANRLESRADERMVELRLIAEGVLLIARRVPPSLVLARLQAYVPPRMWSEAAARAASNQRAAS